MHRRLSLLIFASLIFQLIAAPAASGKTSYQVLALTGCRESLDGTSLICDGEIVDIVNGLSSRLSGPVLAGGGSGKSNTNLIPYERITTGPDGQPCTSIGYREPTGSAAPSDVNIYDGGTRDPAARYSPCPVEPGAAAQPLSPVIIASRYWEQVPLPTPKPHVAPGWAITGKLAFLETNGQLRYVYTNSTPLGALEIVATGWYEVDWGDGEKSGPHSVEGKPWPGGYITHDYVWEGHYDIVVTERWTATWRLGGQSGTLRELHTSGRIDDFPVRQVQAVVR